MTRHGRFLISFAIGLAAIALAHVFALPGRFNAAVTAGDS